MRDSADRFHDLNTCSYCGRENAEDATHCFECGTEFPKAVAVPIDVPPPIPQRSVLTERQLCIAEVWVVCAVAFGGAVYAALSAFGGVYTFRSSGVYGNFSAIHTLLHEAVALALVWWVLARRGESLLSWVVPLRGRDIGHSIVLWIAGSVAYLGCYSALHVLGFTALDSRQQTHAVTQHLWGNHVAFGAFLMAIFNPFFEELIVRAYLMRRVAELTGSMRKAVLVSVLLQTSYHLYQGGASAVSLGVVFFISSVYYARTGRIQVPILAHFFNDFSATFLAAIRFM